MCCKKAVLNIFARFTGKYLYLRFCFNKAAISKSHPYNCFWIIDFNKRGPITVLLWNWFWSTSLKEEGLIQNFVWGYLQDQFWDLFFYIFLQDLLFIVNEVNVTSYANDNTSSFVDTKMHVISRLNISSKACSQWFNQNQKKS